MIQAMFSGISGMKAFKSNLDIIGNNIANVNTTGFKSSKGSFQEMLNLTVNAGGAPSGSRGGINPSQVGLGVVLGNITKNLTAGSMNATGKNTDCAIEGNGFFAVGNSQRTFYTRDGSFTTDGDYNLVTSATGMKALGWSADPITGVMDTSRAITSSSGIKIPVGSLSLAKQTSLVNLTGNLDANASVGTTKQVTYDIYDSLGVNHSVNVTFTKLDTNTNTATLPADNTGTAKWSYNISCAAAGSPTSDQSGILEFDSAGYSTTGNIPASFTLTPSNGSATIPFNVNVKQISQMGGESTVDMNSQDGLPIGTLQKYSIDSSGKINGSFTNGANRLLGQLAVASFNNDAGMLNIGNNLLTEGSNSGSAIFGTAGSGSLGKINAGYLESSNVDLASEFAQMIITQRGFQANSKMITTSDEILNDLIQMKR